MDYLNKVQQGISFIEANLKESLSVEEVARQVSFSQYHFQRIFQSVVGASIAEYIRKRRLTSALHELNTRRVKIIDLAIDYQFESQEAFIRSFKALHGITPAKYYKTNKGVTAMQAQAPYGWLIAGEGTDCYSIGIDKSLSHAGKSSAFIKAINNDADSFATLMQVFKARQYIGKRVRLTAFIKTKQVNWASLWMRIDDDKNESIAFDNMSDRPIQGTNDWNIHQIVLDVSETSVTISLGFLLAQGTGQIWIDSVKFETVDNEVPTTNASEEVFPSRPVNLNFEM